MKKAISLILVLVLCLALCACGEDKPTVPNDTEPSTTAHTHNWKDATCDAPKTCTTCGATEGEKLSHQWVRETCTDPITCTLCNATNGEGDKHYVYNGICETCGKAVEELEKEPGYQYQLALELLSYGSNNEKAYQLLSALGDYKDAAEHLSRFVVIPDVLLYWIYEEHNAFGELTDTICGYYHYDSLGRVVVEPNASYLVLTYVGERIETTYDDNGQIMQTYNTATSRTTQYKYSDDGRLTETKEVYLDGTTYRATSYSYNEAGQLVKEERKDANGDTRITEYTYDSMGRIIREDYPNSRDVSKIYEYDDEGHLIKEMSGSSKNVRVAYHYENGRLVSITYKPDEDNKCTNYIYGDYYCYTPAE